MRSRWRGSWFLSMIMEIMLSFSTAMGEACCADCLDQADPLNSVITYDPLVFDQCNAARGICCYGCSFSHGTLVYQDGVTFDSNGSAQVSAGEFFSFSFHNVSRVTYDFLKINQAQTTFVGNQSTGADSSGDVFSVCVDEPGTIALRGWGADACTQVTDEYKIIVVEGSNTGTCDSSGSAILLGSTSSAYNEPANATGRDATRSSQIGDNNFISCNPDRATVVTQADGSQVCKCTGDWRNPPTCDAFSYVKTVTTILIAAATVISILISVRAYIKSRKEKMARNAADKDANGDSDDDGDDILSFEVIHIGAATTTPGSRCNPLPGIPRSQVRSSFITSEELPTATKETTL